LALLSLEKVLKNKLKTLAEISQNKKERLNVLQINQNNFQGSYTVQKISRNVLEKILSLLLKTPKDKIYSFSNPAHCGVLLKKKTCSRKFRS
jgi:hypothetical protein